MRCRSLVANSSSACPTPTRQNQCSVRKRSRSYSSSQLPSSSLSFLFSRSSSLLSTWRQRPCSTRVLPLSFHSSTSFWLRFMSSLASRLPSQRRSSSSGRGGTRRLICASGRVCSRSPCTRTMPLAAATNLSLRSLSKPPRRTSRGLSELRVSISFQPISTWPAYLVFSASLPPSSRMISPLRRSPLFNQTVSARTGAARATRNKAISTRMIRTNPMGKTKPAESAWPASPPASADARREALYLVLGQIPEGQVVSYGELAQLAGLGRAARWVGRTLSQLPDGTRLPWHRVIAAGGRLSLAAGSPSGAEQRARLRAEGISILNERVDMRRHGWRPME